MGAAQSARADDSQPCDIVPKAGTVLLVVKSDSACMLTVNRTAQGAVSAGKERTVELPPGMQVVQCASTEVPGATTQVEFPIREGCRSIALEVASAWHRYTAQGEVVTDSETGVKWMRGDNGSDIDWNHAKQYCAEKGGRLPSDKELRAIHSGGTVRTPCGEYPCMTSHLFRLSGRFLWSGTPFETDQAIVVGFGSPKPAVQSVKLTQTKDARVLCVAVP